MKPQTPLDPVPRTIALDALDLTFTETGAGRPVVAVHGLPASHRDYRWLDSALEGRVRLFRLDLPGFGGSAEPSDLSFASMGACVAEFCDVLDLDNVVVVGHSMGGAVVVDAAVRSPRISSVVVVNSVGTTQHRGNFPRAYRAILGIAGVHPLVERGLLAALKPVARRVGFSKRIGDDELIRAVTLASQYDPTVFESQLRALDKPVLVAWASEDPAVEPAVSEGIVACARDGESLRFDAKTHNLQSTHAVELADALVLLAQQDDA